jgi:APA family basic amino acid/polyamine antiporter
LAAALPRSGGEYHFLSVIFHPAVGFLAGWISVTVGFAAPVALAAMAFGEYFHTVFPTVPPLPLSLTVVGLVTLVHLRGVAFGSAFQNVATGLKVLLLVLMVGAGWLVSSAAGTTLAPKPGDSQLLLSAPFAVSLVYVMYAYSGWNASTYIIGEVRNAPRIVPLSITIGTLIVTALYVAVNAAFLRTTPMSALAGKVEVAQVAAQQIFGVSGGKIMAGLICAGLISSVSAMTWIGPRVAKTMGEDWRALRLLARTTSSGVPAIAILTQSAIVSVLLITSSFEAVLTYVQFALQLCSLLTVVGLIVLRFRQPNLPRPMRAFGYPFTPLIFLGISAWMLWHIFASKPRESLAGLGTMLLGLSLYFASRAGARRPS